MCGIDEYTATAERDGKSISVYFHWLDGRRFEICDKLLYEEGREVLASGTYSNVGLELLLTFETDTVFHFEETVALSGAER